MGLLACLDKWADGDVCARLEKELLLVEHALGADDHVDRHPRPHLRSETPLGRSNSVRSCQLCGA